MDTHDELIKKTLADPHEAERIILSCCDQYESAVKNAGPIVCIDHETGSYTRMFESGQHNALYMALSQWYQICTKTGQPYTPIAPSMCKKILERLCESEQSIGVAPHNIDKVISVLEDLREEKVYEGWKGLIIELIPEWVLLARVENVNAMFANEGMGNWTGRDYAAAVANAGRGLEYAEEDNFLSGTDLLTKKEERIVRIPTGLTILDNFLRGGFAKKSVAFLHAPSGAGKTVAASQLYTALVKENVDEYKGMYLSTEQGPKELMGRIASCELSIPFDLVKDGVELELLNDRQQKQVTDMLESKIGQNLFLIRWSNPRSLLFMDRMKEYIEKFIDHHGQLDFIVFDWLGDALVEDLRSSHQRLNVSKLYEMAAGDLKALSVEYDTFNLFFTQTHDGQASDKYHNKFKNMQDCKNLHNYVEVGGGISAVTVKKEQSRQNKSIRGRRQQEKEKEDPDKLIFSKSQCWYFEKMRKSPPRPLHVTREFEYQRWGGLHEVSNSESELAKIQKKR